MKKMISVLLAVLFLLGICLMPGCGLLDAFSEKVPTTYSDAHKYTAGNAEFTGKVDTFFLYWQDGSVTIKTHKEDSVKIEETANGELVDSFRVRWYYHNASEYGNVLTVQYSASGKFDFGDLKKDITVYLPENEDMYISLSVQTASVDIDVSQFENTVESVAVNNYSGSVSVRVDNADEIRISGQNDDSAPESEREFFFRANGEVRSLGISSSYAKVDAAAKTVRNGDVGSVFSDLVFCVDEARDLKLSNSEGKIHATVLAFQTLDIETRTDSCELTLSPEASFALTMKEKNRFNQKMTPKSVSVEFDGVTQNGAVYTVGSGESKLTVATDSDLRILSAKQGSY